MQYIFEIPDNFLFFGIGIKYWKRTSGELGREYL